MRTFSQYLKEISQGLDKYLAKGAKDTPGTFDVKIGSKPYNDKVGRVGRKSDEELSSDHLMVERLADKVYRLLGVDVPKTVYTDKKKYFEVIEGDLLPDYLNNGGDVEKVKRMLVPGFVADCLLANWDPMGLDGRNIIVTKTKAYRIDNGGSLVFRARGGLKGSAFGGNVKELDTMRGIGMDVDEFKKEIFGDITNAEIKKQIKKVLEKKDEILKILDVTIKGIKIGSIMEKRIEYLEKWKG